MWSVRVVKLARVHFLLPLWVLGMQLRLGSKCFPRAILPASSFEISSGFSCFGIFAQELPLALLV